MRLIRITSQFKKSLKKILKSGLYNRNEIQIVIDKLASERDLRESNKDHYLHGGQKGNRECHIRSDLLLIYRIENNNLILVLINIGSHSDLFK